MKSGDDTTKFRYRHKSPPISRYTSQYNVSKLSSGKTSPLEVENYDLQKEIKKSKVRAKKIIDVVNSMGCGLDEYVSPPKY